MQGPLRRGFHDQLVEIDGKVTHLFALVIEGLAAATETLLTGDYDAAKEISERDAVIDGLNLDVAAIVERNLLLQAPVAGELKYLLAVLRIVPELERSGDLAEHIASRAKDRIGADLTPAVRGLVAQMGRIGVEMWQEAADAYADRDPTAARRIDAMDDTLDRLHDEISAELLDEAIPRKVAIEMALVARFFERLGDHAVHITERIEGLGPETTRQTG